MFGRKKKKDVLGAPSDVKDVFARFVDGETHMTADQFRLFLVEYQSDRDVTVADAEKIIEQIMNRLHSHVKHPKRTLDLDDFFHYLFCADLNGPVGSQVHHDMCAPLAHYYIYTGHNSYLTGNQLSSDCSDVPIIKALQMGVRVIELDLWPNSSEDDVDVLHGMTLTTPVPLIQCLKSIKEHAFDASPYPCIITFEDHLTPDLQAKVADMVIETFGDLLYYPETGQLGEFPSPESLKHRILISTKPPKENIEAKAIDDKGKGGAVSGKTVDDNGDSDLDDYEDDDDDEDPSVLDSRPSRRRPPQYKHLITIHAGKAKDGIQEALKVLPDKVRRLSLSESGLEKASTTYGTDIVRFTHMNILRVYPKGTRVTSSNYDPHVGWMHGAQMVAFNMQGYGKSLWLMDGMFRGNGGCGYVKKPDFLIEKGSSDEVFDPKGSFPVKKTLKVKLYMGDGWHTDYSSSHFDSFSPPEFYVKFKIVGATADNIKKKSKTINDDWDPVWDEEFTFELTVPELALLQIAVKEDDLSQTDDFAGQTCLPVSELRPGFRAVPLFDEMGEKLKTVRLLMRFEFV